MSKWIILEEVEELIFSKVCLWDGGNTEWGYLKKVEITSSGRKFIFSTEGDMKSENVTHLMKVEPPKE